MGRILRVTAGLGTLLAVAVLLGRGITGKAEAPLKYIRAPDIRYVPTPGDVVEKMLQLAEIKRSDLVYDLGCGDGRILVAAAKRYGCRGVGYDIDPARVEQSRRNVQANRLGRLVTIQQADIFTLDLSRGDVVTLYLLPNLNIKLIPQLEKLKPGARIVSHDFGMGVVEPERVIEYVSQEDQKPHVIFLWKTPLKRTD